MAFTNNYSTSFRWWDFICGTDDKYRAYRAKRAAALKEMKNATTADKAALEHKLMAEVEAEGIIAEAVAGGTEIPKSKTQ